MEKKIMEKFKTVGGHPINDFKRIDPPQKNTSFYLPDYVYEGVMKELYFQDGRPMGDVPVRWTTNGKCNNYNRPDCFIDVEKAEQFLVNVSKSQTT